MKKLAMVAGVGAMATATTLALNPFSASATDLATPTTTTVTASAIATTGHAVKFTAKVSPFKTTTTPVVHAAGLVTFTITGSDSSTVSCNDTDTPSLKPTGGAICKVAPGVLTASASPYTVTASYAGNANFAASTGTLSQSIGLAKATVKVTVDSAPTTHKVSTFTATVTGTTAGAPTGTVTFIVTAQKPHGKVLCQGGNTLPLAATDSTPPQMAAVCTLPANWLKLKKATKSNPSPTNAWTVTAIYNGDKTYAADPYGTKTGTATS